ncbi:uncharacterized protein UV8b_03015 [Ustilaginoidea virens]|uniref:BTB domain-containing protein n=1 Tax=Ustilaginoidea virens TaxID=1159556 RepID=A0A8E5HNU5_USTVR|nr:uncharacterized protein UV8b_03015 [Ustilaginoidea virens]QUC18774.1 hypothetical protein UV8b_03015 [Ustilaginoidea virens]
MAVTMMPSASLAEREDGMATVLEGARQQPFRVNRKLLCEASPFFCQRLQNHGRPRRAACLWLPGESCTTFALFLHWVHSPQTFRHVLEASVSAALETSQRASQDVHWALIRLHLLASRLDLRRLQDLAMDCVQDLYLTCDWDVPPSLIAYLYTRCEAVPAVRARRWAVAMVAFSCSHGGDDRLVRLGHRPQDSAAAAAATSDTARFRSLLSLVPEFAADYAAHVRKMEAAGLDIRFKNPQLRIAANKLRNEQRLFGFRECSFHSHRATVGQARCPHHAVPPTSVRKAPMHRESACVPKPLFWNREA